MTGYFYKLAATAAIVVSASAGAIAQAPKPACQRLEAQLTSLDNGNNDPARADQIRKAEDTINRQQFEIDKLVSQARRSGCENSGFFSIFSNPPPQCGGLTAKSTNSAARWSACRTTS